MKQYQLTDELDEQTPPEFQSFSFAQDVERVAKKLNISEAEIARRMEINPGQLGKLKSGWDGKREKKRAVRKYYFLALRAIEFEAVINAERAREEDEHFSKPL